MSFSASSISGGIALLYLPLPDKMGWEGRVGTTGRESSDRELYFVDLPPRRR